MDQVMDRVSHQPPHRGQQPEPVILEVTNTSRYVEEAVIEASNGDLESDQSDMGHYCQAHGPGKLLVHSWSSLLK